MFIRKIPVLERERKRVLLERSPRSEQPFHIAMGGWGSASPIQQLVTKAFARALMHDSKLPPAIRNIQGMSGQVYRSFINNLVESHSNARYLEIGCWTGSTATAALYGNAAKCVCIDNWSKFGGPKQTFFTNMEMVRSDKIEFNFIEQDFRRVDYKALGTFNIYMYDGPHNEGVQYDGIMIAQPALERSHILIVDDWNWTSVRDGTLRALVEINCRIEFWIEVRTNFEGAPPAPIVPL